MEINCPLCVYETIFMDTNVWICFTEIARNFVDKNPASVFYMHYPFNNWLFTPVYE